jgi:hypothetical protein
MRLDRSAFDRTFIAHCKSRSSDTKAREGCKRRIRLLLCFVYAILPAYLFASPRPRISHPHTQQKSAPHSEEQASVQACSLAQLDGGWFGLFTVPHIFWEQDCICGGAFLGLRGSI